MSNKKQIVVNGKPKIILVDVDETLCTGISWTPEDCLKARPKKEIIKKINKLAPFNFVIIYTARTDDLIPATLKWLRKNGVRFHAISNNKIPCNLGGSKGIIVDDSAVRPEEL